MKMKILFLLVLLAAVGCAQRHTIRQIDVRSYPRQTVHFGFDKSKVQEQDRKALENVVSNLKAKPKAVAIVEGHTDKVGPARYNEILAEKRARAVRVYLRNLGANHRRLTILSKGEREPAVKGWTHEAHQQNRRVEIIMSLIGED